MCLMSVNWLQRVMFGPGPATKIYVPFGATDMRQALMGSMVLTHCENQLALYQTRFKTCVAVGNSLFR